jgi:hypothetical protein
MPDNVVSIVTNLQAVQAYRRHVTAMVRLSIAVLDDANVPIPRRIELARSFLSAICVPDETGQA